MKFEVGDEVAFKHNPTERGVVDKRLIDESQKIYLDDRIPVTWENHRLSGEYTYRLIKINHKSIYDLLKEKLEQK